MVRPALLLLASVGLLAQNDSESLHIQNIEFNLNPRTLVQVHTRVRTQNELREFFQVRFGPILNYAVHKRVTLVGGYYWINQAFSAERERQREDFNRYFGGTIIRVVNRPKLAVDWRLLAEQFQGVPGGNFKRVRTRASFFSNWKRWERYLTVEGLYAQRLASLRVGAGLNRRVHREIVMGFGYEMRQYPNRSIGHIAATSLTYQPGRKD